jgi:orotidine-5'-phosphate decarboxylase
MKPVSAEDRIIVALDVPTLEEALSLIRLLRGRIGFYKVGLSLFTRVGPEGIRRLKDEGIRLFLDLKFHDIPAVVERASASAADMGADMFTVHASGGAAMVSAAARGAREAAESRSALPPVVLGVTVLTSLDRDDLETLGTTGSVSDRVRSLAIFAREAGADGVVSSAMESSMLREALGAEPVIVTPGIRPAGAETGDQKRVVTPAEAVRAGSDYLVIGRPIVKSDDPRGAASKIIDQIETA